MKTLNNKPPSLLNLPIAWTDEDWAQPLTVPPGPRLGCGSLKSARGGLAHRCSHGLRGRRAFTLIELLVVIAIIGILAALLLPTFGRVKLKAKIDSAKIDMRNIEAAIAAYQEKYTIAPVPSPVAAPPAAGFPGVDPGADYSFSETNTDIIVILMDVAEFANTGHRRNTEKHSYLNPGTLKESTTSPGVSRTDYNFRDPWGNPYIIAFDLDYDNAVQVVNTPAGQNNTGQNPRNAPFEPYPYLRIPRAVLIWSMGPDGKAAPLNSDPQGYNKDNVKSWE